MTEIINIRTEKILPTEQEILSYQANKKGYNTSLKIRSMIDDAVNVFLKYSVPSYVYKEISIPDFGEIFEGEGENAEDAPLKKIYPVAMNLYLFAFTLGEKISNEIELCFKQNDFAQGYMLDTVASLAADKSVELLENRFQKNLSDRKLTNGNSRVLGYSPGYCGWALSGQRKLFQFLQPGRIGIALNDSYLMTPLKSVTGVLVHGDKDIHMFENNFEFCEQCKHQTCIDRMERILDN